jgi:hypothetical protein
MHTNMRRRVFTAEDKLIERIDKKEDVAQDVTTWAFYCEQGQARKYQEAKKELVNA